MKSNTHSKSMNNIELLAPAGDLTKAKIALAYGADAIFLGGKQFSLRSRSSNFNLEEIREIISYAHALNKKVYVVANIICRNPMVSEINNFLSKINDLNPNGLIVSDPSIIQIMKKNYPNLDIHISTQQSTTNSKACLFWHRNKAKRIILSRELTFLELELLMKNIKNIIEIEVFIHGAVCIAYSGRCMMSNHFSLRDSNIGGCAQSCRWTYEILGNNKTNKFFTMSAKDMMQIDYVEKLKKIGIKSLKIEGRMKSYHYVATVTNAYRKLLDNDNINKTFLKQELLSCANREFDTAFMDGNPSYDKMLYHDVPIKLKQSYVLDLESQNHDGSINGVVRNNFNINDKMQILSTNNIYNSEIDWIKDANTSQYITNCPTPMQKIIIKFKEHIPISFLSFARKIL